MKKFVKQLFLGLPMAFIWLQCSGGEDEGNDYIPSEEATISVSDLTTDFDENPSEGDFIAGIQASTTSGPLSFSFISESVEGAMTINDSTGELFVGDSSLFDFESRYTLTAVVRVSSGSASQDITVTVNLNDIIELSASTIIWDGPIITFAKANGADPSIESNQDRLTSNVWITRANQGQIYNAVLESSANNTSSPAGTQWARGTLNDLETLSFTSFREACPNGKPKNAVAVPMVLRLIEDNIYLEVRFTSWSSNKQGGFTYERTTME